PLLIGTASGGVWRSTPLAPTWAPLTDNQCTLNVGAVTLDPSNPSIVYAGTGELNGGSFGCGVLRSTDGGTTWTVSTSGLSLVGGGSVPFGALVVDRSSTGQPGSTILLGATPASNAGVVRSTNSGATWTPVLTGYTSSLLQHPTNEAVMYAGDRDIGVASHRGVFMSVDHGLTWGQLPQFPGVSDSSTIGRIELATSVVDPE